MFPGLARAHVLYGSCRPFHVLLVPLGKHWCLLDFLFGCVGSNRLSIGLLLYGLSLTLALPFLKFFMPPKHLDTTYGHHQIPRSTNRNFP